MLLEKQLVVKKSVIENAGKGLFTKKSISKGERIVEYKGKVTTWKEVQNSKDFNGYVFYVTRNNVIDGKPFKKVLSRYANDAAGITRIKGLRNNSKYVIEKGKVYIEALKNIEAGDEILVAYGKEYWDVIKFNNKIEAKKK